MSLDLMSVEVISALIQSNIIKSLSVYYIISYYITTLASMAPESYKHRSSKNRDKSAMLSDKFDLNLGNVKNNLALLDKMLSERPQEWEGWLSTARSAMRAIDAMRFFRETGRLQEQTWLIQILQDYSFHDADDGCIRDISQWCQSSWLRILRDHPDNVTILKGTLPI